jgi:hypothetical protein
MNVIGIDYGQSQIFGSHVNKMSKNIPAFVNLTNLDNRQKKAFTL